ncbi:hypothetical protein NSA19_02810 [Actinomyces bowdenii]|uniref:hypothetical protein n=1 Tax=Actinomyces bowdenii TaxID=131109 RepID=UPI00214C9166|nr:hypothetical protein [Actinomyces bowdenii]MCR2051800.1 hypothetical protein [Actinomyces bowdenii]
MKPPNKPITNDLPRLRDIVRGIRKQEVILNNVSVLTEAALLGELAMSAVTLRSRVCSRSDRAAALRHATRYAAALMTLNEDAPGADVRIAADMCRVADDPNLEREFNRNVTSRKEWAGRLSEVLDEAMLAKAHDNRDVMNAHLARWVTLCTLWVALILDEKEPE